MLSWWCKALGGKCEQVVVVGRCKSFLLDETNVDVPSKQSPRSSERTPPGGSARCSAVQARGSALSGLYYGQWCRSVPALYRVRVDHAAKIAGKVDWRRRGSGSLLFKRRARDAMNRVVIGGTGWEKSERQTSGYDAKRVVVFCRLGRPFGSGPDQPQLSLCLPTMNPRGKAETLPSLGTKPARVESRPPSCLGRSRQRQLLIQRHAVLGGGRYASVRFDLDINPLVNPGATKQAIKQRIDHPTQHATCDIR